MPTPGDKSKVKTWRNAYVHFADKKRVDLVKEHPTLDNATISRELGRLWKALPTEERNVWVNLAAYDRARYIAECQIHATTTALGTLSTAAPQPTKAPIVDTSSSEYDMSSSFSMLSPHPPSASSHGATPASSYGDPLGQFSLPNLDTTSPVAVSSSKKRKRVSTGSHLQLAYYYFRRTKRDSVLAGNPTMLSADLNREIGRQWHALRPEERQPWMQLAVANAKSGDASASALCPKLKDPLAPKAPRSAFQFLVESRRQEHSTMAYNALTKESAQLWRAMPDDRKAPWVKLAREDRLRYEGEMKTYKPPSYARDVGGAARCADPGKGEKKPLSAYAHFFRDKRGLHPGLSFIELTHELSRQWKAMSMDDKRPWVQRALDEKAQLGPPPPAAPPSNRKKPTQSPVAPPRKESSIPRRPKSAFVHFQLETRRSMPDLPYKDFMQKIAAMWKAKSDAEKMAWHELAKQDLDRYTRACASASSSAAAATTAMAPDASPTLTTVRGGGKSPVSAALRLRHGFACFVQAKKHDVLAKTPHLTHNELLHEVGKLWRDMSPLERQPWQDLMQDKKAPAAAPSTAPACPRPSPESATQSQDSPAPVLVDDSQQHHLELMEGLWGEDVEGVTQHIFYEDDLVQSHHLSLPMMEDMDAMHHHAHSSDLL